jgi:hypothetical protein
VVDSAAVHAVLDPPVTLSAGEAHRLLEAVRRGAGLLVVVQPGTALADSLGLARTGEGTGGTLDLAPPALCPDSLNQLGLIRWIDGRVSSWWLTRFPARGAVGFAAVRVDSAALRAERTLRWRDSLPPPPPVPAWSTTSDEAPVPEAGEVTRPAVLGFPLGRGRVVAVADPDLLRNDVVRVCRWDAGLTAMRALAWLGETGGRRVVFDEYHHGYGTHADPIGAMRRALLYTGAGRGTIVLAAAALVLLAALGRRPLAPRAQPVVERRSPLEHVDALARAYARVGATRLAARRLVRGLRRRHAVGAQRAGDDGDWLRTVAARHPELAPHATRLEQALAGRVPPAGLAAVGEAVTHFDQRLRPDR